MKAGSPAPCGHVQPTKLEKNFAFLLTKSKINRSAPPPAATSSPGKSRPIAPLPGGGTGKKRKNMRFCALVFARISPVFPGFLRKKAPRMPFFSVASRQHAPGISTPQPAQVSARRPLLIASRVAPARNRVSLAQVADSGPIRTTRRWGPSTPVPVDLGNAAPVSWHRTPTPQFTTPRGPKSNPFLANSTWSKSIPPAGSP
jgi:hypothetical protein